MKSQAKPFEIPKWEVKEAWEEVRANKGAPGVDGQSLDDFAKDLKCNLYKVWNRMSSGSYFPLPVRAVEIPKPHGGGTRILFDAAVPLWTPADPVAIETTIETTHGQRDGSCAPGIVSGFLRPADSEIHSRPIRHNAVI